MADENEDLLTFQPLNDTMTQDHPLSPEQPLPTPTPSSIFSITYYRKYFDVDTLDVGKRLLMAMNPLNNTFLHEITSPDLYGPIWLSITGAFLMGVFGNLSGWLRGGGSWTYNFYAFAVGLFVTFVFVFGVPFAFRWATRNLQCPPTTSLICLFGYTTGFMPPTGLICLLVPRIGVAAALCGGIAMGLSLFNKLSFEFKQHGTAGFALVPNLAVSVLAVAVLVVVKLLLFR